MYRICPDCGAYLDPDERCDCWKDPATGIPAATIDPQIIPTLQEWRKKVQRDDPRT